MSRLQEANNFLVKKFGMLSHVLQSPTCKLLVMHLMQCVFPLLFVDGCFRISVLKWLNLSSNISPKFSHRQFVSIWFLPALFMSLKTRFFTFYCVCHFSSLLHRAYCFREEPCRRKSVISWYLSHTQAFFLF